MNGRPDALSRRPDYFVATEPTNFQTVLQPHQIQLNAIVHSLPLNIHFDSAKDWPLIIADFLEDPESGWIPDLPLPLLNFCKQEAKWFCFRGSTLCRILPDQQTMISYCRYSSRKTIIKHYHESLAHLRTDSIYDLIYRRCWWPNMKSDIKAYIRTCPECQLNTSANGVYQTKPITPIPPVALPFERWGMDFMGPLPVTNSGNIYIITAIDYATRWVVAKAVKSMETTVVIEFLYEEIMINYGAPHEIITDRGKSFLSAGIQEFERIHGIDHMLTAPYHPQTNGMIERMHAMIKHSLTTLTKETPSRWDEFLLQTIFALRTRTHAVTKFSPFFLLYGVHPRLEYDDDLAPPYSLLTPLDELEELEANGEFFARTFEYLGQDRAASYARSRSQMEIMRKRGDFNEWSSNPVFEVNDMVKMKNHDHSKFEFNWRGPYFITDIGHNGTYYLMTPAGLRLDAPINQDDLAPWLSVTNDNESYFYDGTRRSNMAEISFERGESVNSLTTSDRADKTIGGVV
jgi:transposase InsO family protein